MLFLTGVSKTRGLGLGLGRGRSFHIFVMSFFLSFNPNSDLSQLASSGYRYNIFKKSHPKQSNKEAAIFFSSSTPWANNRRWINQSERALCFSSVIKQIAELPMSFERFFEAKTSVALSKSFKNRMKHCAFNFSLLGVLHCRLDGVVSHEKITEVHRRQPLLTKYPHPWTRQQGSEEIKAPKNNVVVPHHVLLSKTRYRETLEVLEARQYKSHGLIHVADAYFETG